MQLQYGPRILQNLMLLPFWSFLFSRLYFQLTITIYSNMILKFSYVGDIVITVCYVIKHTVILQQHNMNFCNYRMLVILKFCNYRLQQHMILKMTSIPI